jgi:release factor glutamine methyltransferase
MEERGPATSSRAYRAAVSGVRSQREVLAARLSAAGFLQADAEARELVAAAGGDAAVLDGWLARRLDGEPLAWLTGFTTFLGHRMRVDRGVYVPRPHTEPLARRAVELLPARGCAVDLCTGSGALAVALRHARPHARVVATDSDPVAVRCAAANGVEVHLGHLDEPVPPDVRGVVDVVVAVVPYVPTDELVFLPRDVRRHEPATALDGGSHGTEVLEQVVAGAPALLRPGGRLHLEVGGRQDEGLASALAGAGLDLAGRLVDEEGDLRGVEAVRRQ